MLKLKQTRKEWRIVLYSSSPESIIINNLNQYRIRVLNISHTPLNTKSASILSEILITNEIIKTPVLQSSSLSGCIKHVSHLLSNNSIVKKLILWHVTITDEDMPIVSNMIVNNKTLKELHLS